MGAARICEHDNPQCGCWVDEAGRVRRHAFRFLKGDRVRHATWTGFTGTVQRDTAGNRGQGLYVEWTPIPGLGAGATPTPFPALFDVTHGEDV